MSVLGGMIAAERGELADVLDGLTAVQWEQASLCRGWTVRHLVAHQTMPFRYSTARFLLELARAAGRFDRMTDAVAHRDGMLPPSELTAALRDNADHPWKPPGQGLDAPLTHDVVHGLDVTDALGLGREVPAERLLPVLERLASSSSRRYFGVALDDVELRADDLGWASGSGAPLIGRGQDLVLLLTGRSIGAERFTGAGVDRIEEVTDARDR
jgi:uncharacterized protein (TIGR03083 family)